MRTVIARSEATWRSRGARSQRDCVVTVFLAMTGQLLCRFRADTGGLDNAPPALGLRHDELAKRSRCSRSRLDALIEQALYDRRRRKRAIELGVELRDDRSRCMRRHE